MTRSLTISNDRTTLYDIKCDEVAIQKSFFIQPATV